MRVLRLALRNLRRNLRRSIITGIAISLGLALLIVSSGFGDGAHGAMIEKGVATMAGHVVVQGAGWQQKRDNDILVPDTPAVVSELRAMFPDATVTQRVYLQGLLTSPTGSVGVGLSAVLPDDERRVDDLHQKFTAGSYLDGQPNGLVLGQTLAETLGVGVGDKVVLMIQKRGEIVSQLFRVQGLFKVGVDEIDGFYAQIPLATAQQMLGLGREVTQVSLHLKSHKQAAAATERVRAALAAPGLEILPWQEALPDLFMWIALDDAGLYIMILIIAVVVLLGIVNTVLMSVLERVREFGVMLAIGAAPRQLVLLVLTEAALLGLFAVIVGLALGLLGNWPLAANGLNFSDMTGGQAVEAGGVALDLHFRTDLSPGKVALFCLLSFVMTVVSAIYPAVKVATLKPIACLQHR
ncbi:MAG: ABC transporter permease [Deltaproteobacteria bacterium]|nr:ABC transporter permease [Deltaproteobacteria bacterium]